MDCDSSANPKTGAASARVGVIKGDEHVNAKAGVYAAKTGVNPAMGGAYAAQKKLDTPVTTGVYAGLNANGNSLKVQHGHTQGNGSVTTTNAQVNIFDNKMANMNGHAFHTNTRTQDQFGAGLNFNTTSGNSASLDVKHIPKHNTTTMSAAGKVNLITSGNFTLDGTGNASRHMSGPSRGRTDFGAGIHGHITF